MSDAGGSPTDADNPPDATAALLAVLASIERGATPDVTAIAAAINAALTQTPQPVQVAVRTRLESNRKYCWKGDHLTVGFQKLSSQDFWRRTGAATLRADIEACHPSPPAGVNPLDPQARHSSLRSAASLDRCYPDNESTVSSTRESLPAACACSPRGQDGEASSPTGVVGTGPLLSLFGGIDSTSVASASPSHARKASPLAEPPRRATVVNISIPEEVVHNAKPPPPSPTGAESIPDGCVPVLLGRQVKGAPPSNVLNLASHALFLIPADESSAAGRFRRRVFHFIDSPGFERAVLFVIVLNSVALAMDIPATRSQDGVQDFLVIAEIFFQTVFTLEIMTKVVALGFVFHPFAYLRSSWNCMDFVIVLTGFVSLLPQVGNFTILRLLRVVRPLRMVNRVPQMRGIMNAIVQSLPGMRDVFFLLTFLVVIFAIVGVQLFKGKLHRRCFVGEDAVNSTGSAVDAVVPPQCHGGMCLFDDTADSLPCGGSLGGRRCEVDPRYPSLTPFCDVNTHLYHEGVLNWDVFYSAALLVFKIITLDDWPVDLLALQMAIGWWVWMYFLVVTLFGAFFCIQLFLAVLSLEYYRTRRVVDDEEEDARYAEDEANITEIVGCLSAPPPADDKAAKAESPMSALATSARHGSLSRQGVLGHSSSFRRGSFASLVSQPSVVAVARIRVGADHPAPSPRRRKRSNDTLGTAATDDLQDSTSVSAHERPVLLSTRNASMRTARSMTRGKSLLNTQAMLARRSVVGGSKSVDALPRLPKGGAEQSAGDEPYSPFSWAATSHAESASVASGAMGNSMTTRRAKGRRSRSRQLEDDGLGLRVPSETGTLSPRARVGCEGAEGGERGAQVQLQPGTAPRRDTGMGAADGAGEGSRFQRFLPLGIPDMNEDLLSEGSRSDGSVSQTDDHYTHKRKSSVAISFPRRVSTFEPPPPPPPQTTFQATREAVRHSVTHRRFGVVMLCVTLFNVLVLALDHHNSPRALDRFISWSNFTCSLIFILELLLKLFALGVVGYFTEEYEDEIKAQMQGNLVEVQLTKRRIDAFNTFDFVLVLVSIPELALAGDGSGSNFSALRIFRLARILKVMANVRTLRQLLVTILASMSAVAYLFLIMLLFIFVCSIMGLQLFEGKFPADSRTNFNTLWESCTTVFILITGESWATIMREGIESTNFLAFFYFIIVFFFGNYLLTNLFIAILIDEFMQTKEDELLDRMSDIEHQEEERMAAAVDMKWQRAISQLTALADNDEPSETTSSSPSKMEVASLGSRATPQNSTTAIDDGSVREVKDSARDASDTPHAGGAAATDATGTSAKSKVPSDGDVRGASSSGAAPPAAEAADDDPPRPPLPKDAVDDGSPPAEATSDTASRIGLPRRRSMTSREVEERHAITQASWWAVFLTFVGHDEWARVMALRPEGRADAWDIYGEALFLRLGRTHPLRQAFAMVVMHPLFEIAILLIILMNVVALAVDRPDLSRRSRTVLDRMDIAFTVLFCVESVLKATVMGFYEPKGPDGLPKAYLTHKIAPPSSTPLFALAPVPNSATACDDSNGDNCVQWEAEALHNTPPTRSSMGVWNRVDLFVVVTAFIGIGLPQLRLARSLRTIRLVVHIRGIRVVLKALLDALTGLANVALVCSMLWMVFGILAVQLYKGRFYYCTDPDVDTRVECNGTYLANTTTPYGVEEVLMDREWRQLRYHFDHLGAAMLTLFEVAVGEGWATIMFSGIDTRGIDLNLRTNATPVHALFFCIFVVVGQFFAMNLFVGMLIDVFTRSQGAEDGSILMTPVQREWVRANKLISHIELEPVALPPTVKNYTSEVEIDGQHLPVHLFLRADAAGTLRIGARREPVVVQRVVGDHHIFGHRFDFTGTRAANGDLCGHLCIRRTVTQRADPAVPMTLTLVPESTLSSLVMAVRSTCFHVVMEPYFDATVTALILLNVLVMCLEHYGQSAFYDDFLYRANIVFVACFTLEAVAKVSAVGPKSYFSDDWNKFDFTLVVLSCVSFILGGPGLSTLRIGRVVRLIRRAENLQKLFGTLVQALPSLANVSMLLVITYFIFGVVGVSLFGSVTLDGNPGLTPYTNFRSVPEALLTLYIVATTETWTDVMAGCMANPDNSGCTHEDGNCGSVVAIPYFVCFMVLGSFVLLNLFVTIVLDEFNNLTENDDPIDPEVDEAWEGLATKEAMSTHQRIMLLDVFRNGWVKHDPLAQGKLRVTAFITLVKGWCASEKLHATAGVNLSNLWMQRFLSRLALPLDENLMVKYRDAVRSLLRELFQITDESARACQRFVKTDFYAAEKYLMVHHFFAVQKISLLWRRRRESRLYSALSPAAPLEGEARGTDKLPQYIPIMPDIDHHNDSEPPHSDPFSVLYRSPSMTHRSSAQGATLSQLVQHAQDRTEREASGEWGQGMMPLSERSYGTDALSVSSPAPVRVRAEEGGVGDAPPVPRLDATHVGREMSPPAGPRHQSRLRASDVAQQPPGRRSIDRSNSTSDCSPTSSRPGSASHQGRRPSSTRPIGRPPLSAQLSRSRLGSREGSERQSSPGMQRPNTRSPRTGESDTQDMIALRGFSQLLFPSSDEV